MSNLNTSGWRVPEYRILVLPEKQTEKTKGGIILPQTTQDDLQSAKTIATIVDFGAKAFDNQSWPDKPQKGDKVLIPSYCGYKLIEEQAADKLEYRIILDRDILAVQTQEAVCQ